MVSGSVIVLIACMSFIIWRGYALMKEGRKQTDIYRELIQSKFENYYELRQRDQLHPRARQGLKDGRVRSLPTERQEWMIVLRVILCLDTDAVWDDRQRYLLGLKRGYDLMVSGISLSRKPLKRVLHLHGRMFALSYFGPTTMSDRPNMIGLSPMFIKHAGNRHMSLLVRKAKHVNGRPYLVFPIE